MNEYEVKVIYVVRSLRVSGVVVRVFIWMEWKERDRIEEEKNFKEGQWKVKVVKVRRRPCIRWNQPSQFLHFVKTRLVSKSVWLLVWYKCGHARMPIHPSAIRWAICGHVNVPFQLHFINKERQHSFEDTNYTCKEKSWKLFNEGPPQSNIWWYNKLSGVEAKAGRIREGIWVSVDVEKKGIQKAVPTTNWGCDSALDWMDRWVQMVGIEWK